MRCLAAMGKYFLERMIFVELKYPVITSVGLFLANKNGPDLSGP